MNGRHVGYSMYFCKGICAIQDLRFACLGRERKRECPYASSSGKPCRLMHKCWFCFVLFFFRWKIGGGGGNGSGGVPFFLTSRHTHTYTLTTTMGDAIVPNAMQHYPPSATPAEPLPPFLLSSLLWFARAASLLAMYAWLDAGLAVFGPDHLQD